MGRTAWMVLGAALVTAGWGRVQAGSALLTFEGLQNFEQVASYYAGGYGSLGTGPGPEYGLTFSSYGLAYIPGAQTGNPTPFPGDPSPPTVLLLFTQSIGAGYPASLTMNSAGGFSDSISFYDVVNSTAGSVELFSGLNGTGTMLAQQTLSLTGVGVFSGPLTVTFSGTAYSAVFTGSNDNFAVDNISFISLSVPEPSSFLLLMLGLGSSYMTFRRRRTEPSWRLSPRELSRMRS